MTEHKKIMINESFFNTNNKTKKNKSSGRPKKETIRPVLKPNSMKKTLLEKIKKHQQAEKMSKQVEINSTATTNDAKFTDDFMNSMEYLSKLGDKNRKMSREKKKRNRTQKNKTGGAGLNTPPVINLPTNIKSSELISIDLPPEFDTTSQIPPQMVSQTTHANLINKTNNSMNTEIQHLPLHNIQQPTLQQPIVQQPIQMVGGTHEAVLHTDMPYGCLKQGTKPTYRQYHNKTLKHNHHVNNTVSNLPDNVIKRQHKLAKLKNTCTKKRQRKKITKKRTYTLGKHGGNLSVLIKNNNTRRTVRKEQGLLKQKSINEVKKYLYDKNLLKIGSAAPNDVLRTLYEQSILAGDITNVSNDIQFHNFVNNVS
jgi:hypothetical protein